MKDLEREILTYLVKHPRARDTVEGMVEWWLLEQRIQRESARIRDAVARLVARGFLEEVGGPDGRPHYRINRRRWAAIEEFLKELAG